MKERIKQYIVALQIERAHIKLTLKNLGESLSEDEVNAYLERLSEIKTYIDKLEKGLK